MLNIPEYKEYGGETKIALMDNSSLAFMHELSQRSYPSDGILSVYDLILIPKWVMEEIEDSTYRSTYVEQLQAKGYSRFKKRVNLRRFLLLFSVHPEPNGRKVDKMLTLKKVKELVEHRCTVDCTPTCVASDCAAVCGGICT